MIGDDETAIDGTTIFRFDELVPPRQSASTFQPPRVENERSSVFFSRGRKMSSRFCNFAANYLALLPRSISSPILNFNDRLRDNSRRATRHGLQSLLKP